MKRFLAFLLALLIPLCVLAEEPEPTEEPAGVDLLVDQQFGRRSHQVHCGEIVVARDGKIIYQRSFGYLDGTNRTVPVTSDNYYRIASVSKLVTATAVMRLVELGEWDLDENIGTYLGGDNPFFAASRRYPKVGITTRMLMSHTSCIWVDRFAEKPPMIKFLMPKTSNIEYFYEEKPGTKYHYSNYAAGMLGCMIEVITGQRLDDAVTELIFDRMGIDAAYSPDYLNYPDRITSEVEREYSDGIDIDHDYVFSYGNCWMRCMDLCRIGMMLCDGGVYEGRRILEEDTVQQMISSQMGVGGITVDSPYGLNVQRVNIPTFDSELMFYGHQGMSGNCLCAVYFNPETRFVFAMTSVCTDPKNNMGKQYTLRNLVYDLFKVAWEEFGGR